MKNEACPDGETFVDLVQVRGKSNFGSGLLVGQGLVLTALHCVRDKNDPSRPVRDLGVYLLRDLKKESEYHFDAEIAWPQLNGLAKDAPDIAILRIVGPDIPEALAAHNFGKPPKVPTIGSARGFPVSSKGDELPGGRVEHDQPGWVHYASLTRRALTFDAFGQNELKGRSRWAGLSGGPVMAQGLVVGVMRELPETWGGSSVVAEPLGPVLADDPALRDLLGVNLPLEDPSDPVQSALLASYAVIGTGAMAASDRVLREAKNAPFFGRKADQDALDSALLSHDRGVLLMRGEAGLGKTRLAADWADRCEGFPGVTVLRHAFSVRDPDAASRTAMVESLVRQAADQLAPRSLGPGEPGDGRRLSDRLQALLAEDRPPGRRLLLVLDGLDEAAELIKPWSVALGRGVFVLATCRAEQNEDPRALRSWREWAVNDDVLTLDHRLGTLDEDAVATWLSAALEREVASADPLVTRAMHASEGVPLFLRYLIPEAVEALHDGVSDPFPESFGDYARRQLSDLRDQLTVSGRWPWSGVLELFALLSGVKAPLSQSAIRKLIGSHHLDELDQRAERWLWRRQAEGSDLGLVSFAHPRLATVFRSALPSFEPEIVSAMEERLVEACLEVWDTTGHNPLLSYALTWLPAHLAKLDRSPEAADLLGSGDFLLARFRKDPTSSTAHRTATETMGLPLTLSETHPAASWRRFWAETEAAVVSGMNMLPAKDAIGVLAQLAHDRFGADEPALGRLIEVLPKDAPRLARPCGFQHPNLLRSLDDTHWHHIRGIVPLTDRLVSWGGDGAIRFWSLAGEPRPGGDLHAHPYGPGPEPRVIGIDGGVVGVLALADRLASWGNDGGLRFWSLTGEPRSGGDAQAHRGGVSGVLILADQLVSWGGDGAIRFWSLTGEPRAAGDVQAHRGRVSGVLALSDGLVSWGWDGAIRFWSLSGETRSWGIDQAHRHTVSGVLALPDRLVSWGDDGALRFWSLTGKPQSGGDVQAHRGGVSGVLVLADQLVSWGDDGAILFWSWKGTLRRGSEAQRHKAAVDGVLAVPNGFVSWGRDGAIRFWSLSGGPLGGGDDRAHDGPVDGVLALADELVSWGWDGAIRFWNLAGEPRPGGDVRAHRYGVSGVLTLSDRLVSWGRDRSIRFWSFGREHQPGSRPRTGFGYGIEGVLALPDGGLVSWGGDGRIGFWDANGSPRQRGVHAHDRHVRGVLLAQDGLVSWGTDSAIRFWSLTGEPQLGRESQHHPAIHGMLALSDGLVSWGGREIRFWTCIGAPRTDIPPCTLDWTVDGMLALSDGLVSWGEDGTIRFWSLTGEPRGRRQAHTPRGERKEYAIGGVLTLSDALVSWGMDGAIRFWGFDGEPRPGGGMKAHGGVVRGVRAIPNGLLSWGDDGAMRFWSPTGEPRLEGNHGDRQFRIRDVLILQDELVVWGRDDGVVRLWNPSGMLRSTWLAPSELELLTLAGGRIWAALADQLYELTFARPLSISRSAAATGTRTRAP